MISTSMPKMKNRIFAALTALFVAALPILAVESDEAPLRPVLSAYTLEIGSAHIAETYLSPLKYSGTGFAFNYERMQAMRFNPEKFVMQLQTRLDFQRTRNPARNATMLRLALDARWGMARRWHVADVWTVIAGGSTRIEAGVLYNARNSNNPAAVKAAWTVNALGAVAYATNLKKVPVCLRYQAELPLTGMFFSPQYGELYYEIYLGNHKGLLRGAWPGNYFGLNNLLTADFRFGGTTLRLGYRLNVQSVKASDIVTRRIEHYAVVGVVCQWLSLAPKSNLNKPIVDALY